MASVYDANETMRLIGNQKECIITIEDHKAIDDIVNATIDDSTRDLSMIKYDLFKYGYIQGIRAERRRRKREK